MKILITGAKGQLGSELEKVLTEKKCSIGAIGKDYDNCDYLTLGSTDLDITDFEKAKEILEVNKPDIVINCAAYTNVDECESNPEKAMAVNAVGAKNLAVICQGINSKLVHISTDYVFDGESESPYCEWDLCNPKTIYGKSKLLGERYVREFAKKYFIIRTSWLYGKNGKNFVKTIIDLGKKKNKIEVVNDQIGNPTNVNDLAYHILDIATTEDYGIYNCVGEGCCSWFDLAAKIVDYADLSCKVAPVTTLEYQKIDFRAAKRPRNSSLCNLMLKVCKKNRMRRWEETLKDFVLDAIKK